MSESSQVYLGNPIPDALVLVWTSIIKPKTHLTVGVNHRKFFRGALIFAPNHANQTQPQNTNQLKLAQTQLTKPYKTKPKLAKQQTNPN